MDKNRKIVFRADGSSEIGMGHFVRTLALAEMLREDFHTVFALRTPSAYQRIEVSKICNELLPLSEDSYFEEFVEYLQGDEIVVLDNYFYSTDYQKEIKDKGCRLVCIDDMHDKHYVADIVINHAPGLTREDFSLESYTQLCTGFNWALLRSAFLDNVGSWKNSEHTHIEKVAVCFGGVDSHGLSQKVKEVLHDQEVRIITNMTASQVAACYQWADVAVVSASTAMLEALAIGVPIVAGYYVDNQVEVYNRMSYDGFFVGVGNLLECQNIENIRHLISQKTESSVSFAGIKDRYTNLFQSMLPYSFQKGGYSFVDYIHLNIEQHKIIHSTRNHPDIRRWMVNKEEFSFEEHLQFVKRLALKEYPQYWAVFDGQRYVSSVCFNQYDPVTMEAEVGNFVIPDEFDTGLGVEIVYMFSNFAYRSLGVKIINVSIKNENKGVVMFIKKLGYTITSIDNEYTYAYLTADKWCNMPDSLSEFIKIKNKQI